MLNWDTTGTALQYQIRGRILNTPNWTYLQINNPIQNQLLANGLSNNTSYEWQIRSICAPGDSSVWSPLDTFTTGCYPTDTTWSSPVTSNGARLNWQHIPGAIAYEITGKRVGASQWTTLLQGNVFDYRNVFGLQPGFSYQWTVRAWCDSVGNISSPWAALDTFTTLPFSAARHSNDTIIASEERTRQSPATSQKFGGLLHSVRNDGLGWASFEEGSHCFGGGPSHGSFDQLRMTGPLQVFPNPTTDQFQIQYAGNLPAEITIWSATGQLVQRESLTTPYLLLATNNWPAGIYMVEVNPIAIGSDGRIERTKILKQ